MIEQSASLRVEGLDADVRVLACEVEERISAPTTAWATIAAYEDGGLVELDVDEVIGKAATLTLRFHDVERSHALLVEAIDDQGGRARISLASPVARLDDTSDYRVFIDESATDIAARVLDEHGIRLDLRARRAAPKRHRCTQVFESDLAFVTRLFAEEGMSWLPSADDPGVLHVVDAAETFFDDGLAIPWREEAGFELGRAAHAIRLRRRAAIEKASLRDYDFERPMLDLHREAGDGSLEWYEHPGGFTSPDVGQELAAIRLAQHRAEAIVLEGEATEPELRAGGIVELTSVPDELPDDRWLVIAATHVVKTRGDHTELTYDVRFQAVPASAGYRSARPAPPARGGVGTAIATGAAGEEIAVDAFGRTRVLARWDRRNPADQRASGFARVAQPQLSGAIFNPRVGWEELVGVADRVGELPVVLGRVYNAVQAPPTALPAKKVETHFGTRTTPNGASGNFLQISDAAGQESFSLNASGNYDEQTENDKLTEVAVNDVRLVLGGRKLIVKERVVERVAGAQSITVGGLRTVTTDSNYGVQAASERVIVGAARVIRAGGDYLTKTPNFVRVVAGAKAEVGIEHQSVFTTGASTLIVGGSMKTDAGASEAVGVGGAAVIKVSGAQTIVTGSYALTVRGVYAESFGSRTVTAPAIGESFATASYTSSGAASITSAQIAVQADAQLTIRAGGATITMTPASITIQGDYDSTTASVETGTHCYG